MGGIKASDTVKRVLCVFSDLPVAVKNVLREKVRFLHCFTPEESADNGAATSVRINGALHVIFEGDAGKK